MFRPRRGFCQNWAWLILKASLYGSWIFGLFPFIYNSRRKQMSRSKWLQVYGLVLNFLLIFLLLYCNYEATKGSKLDAFKRSPLLEEINKLIGIMSVLVAFVVHLMNFFGSNNVLWIVNELLTLEYRHFGGVSFKNCPKLNCLVIHKSGAIIGAIVTLMAVHYGMPGNPTTLLVSLLMCITQVGLNLNVMHCYVGVLLIYRYVWLINGQLWDLANQLRVDSTEDSSASRIRELLSLYRRLFELNRKLQAAYELQMTLMLSTGLAGNIVIIFFLVVYGISMGKVTVFLVVFPQSLLVNIWDFWLGIAVCDLSERTGRGTSAILKLFCDLESLEVELERSVNEFSWLCSQVKFRFQLYGLFSVNHSMGFHMTITSYLYLLYLVQFDYMNL